MYVDACLIYFLSLQFHLLSLTSTLIFESLIFTIIIFFNLFQNHNETECSPHYYANTVHLMRLKGITLHHIMVTLYHYAWPFELSSLYFVHFSFSFSFFSLVFPRVLSRLGSLPPFLISPCFLAPLSLPSSNYPSFHLSFLHVPSSHYSFSLPSSGLKPLSLSPSLSQWRIHDQNLVGADLGANLNSCNPLRLMASLNGWRNFLKM